MKNLSIVASVAIFAILSFAPRTDARILSTRMAGKAVQVPASEHRPADSLRLSAEPDEQDKEKQQLKRVLFIGDSMTGWMAERMQAYGLKNGFEVSTVLWDGSTLSKWASSGRIAEFVGKYKPDLVCISLGMNEMLERNPETRLSSYLKKILAGIGTTPYLWVGPPSWPGKGKGETLNTWLRGKLAEGCFFQSCDLELARQSKTNPHPTKDAIRKWIDSVVEFLNSSPAYDFEELKTPTGVQMQRGKVFIYRKMNQKL